MKFFLLFTIAIFYITPNLAQNKGLTLGIQYNQTSRSVYDDYLKEISTYYNLSKPLVADQSYGFTIGYVAGSDKVEFEGGGSLNFSNNEATNADATEAVRIKNTDIDIFFGGNYLPKRYLVLGGQLVLHASSNDLENASGNGGESGISSPEDDFNIFKGYSVVFRAQAGVNIPLNDKGMSCRILPYYDLGITKYDFIKSSKNFLTSYDGSPKTNYNAWGVKLLFVFKNM